MTRDGAITIRQGDFDAFFAAPLAAYGPESLYVSPLKGDLARFLDRRANPLFADPGSDLDFFTVHRGDRIVGRITAHVHAASNRLHGTNDAAFGYFDVADDADAAKALLDRAEDWARARGHATIAGNFNLTAMQQIGVLTDGFDHPPHTDQIWSPPHVARLLTENGYVAEFGMATALVDLAAPAPAVDAGEVARILSDPDFRLIPVTRRNLAARMEDARTILNLSFARNPMFVPVSRDEFHFQARDMKWIMDPRLSMVLHWQGRPGAAVIVIPDVNPLLRAIRSRLGVTAPFHVLRHRLTNRRAVLIYAGVIPELQGRGVAPFLLSRAMQAARDAGYHSVGNTWIADVNRASLAQLAKAGAQPAHRLHLFRKAL